MAIGRLGSQVLPDGVGLERLGFRLRAPVDMTVDASLESRPMMGEVATVADPRNCNLLVLAIQHHGRFALAVEDRLARGTMTLPIEGRATFASCVDQLDSFAILWEDEAHPCTYRRSIECLLLGCELFLEFALGKGWGLGLGVGGLGLCSTGTSTFA